MAGLIHAGFIMGVFTFAYLGVELTEWVRKHSERKGMRQQTRK